MRNAAIVDAYSTGRYLPAALARRGFSAVHVQSTSDPPAFFRSSFIPRDFCDNIVYDADLERTLARLMGYDLAFVLPGSEYGVELSDLLSERLGLPSNGSARTLARRNKHHMAGALREAGLRAIEAICARDNRQIIAWAMERGRWPIVLKPLDSAGSDGIFFCSDEAEISRAFSQIAGRRNAMGSWNHAVLAQEFLDGTEYFINTVSYAGHHHVAEIWRYRKRIVPGKGTIYDMEEPVPWDGEVQAELRRYVIDVLDALGIWYGPAHSEIMLTSSGPVLIETGARLAGSILPHAVSRCFETNHVELTVEAYADPEGFRRHCGVPYRLRTNLRYVSLIVPRKAILRSLHGFDALRRLPSFHDMHVQLQVRPGLRADHRLAQLARIRLPDL